MLREQSLLLPSAPRTAVFSYLAARSVAIRILKMLDLNFAKAANRCRCKGRSLGQGGCDPRELTWTGVWLKAAPRSILLPALSSHPPVSSWNAELQKET